MAKLVSITSRLNKNCPIPRNQCQVLTDKRLRYALRQIDVVLLAQVVTLSFCQVLLTINLDLDPNQGRPLGRKPIP